MWGWATGGQFIQEYVNATVPYMAFGEFWDTCEYTDGVLNYNQDTHRQRTVNWCDATGGTSAAFDFTTKGLSAFRPLDPPFPPPSLCRNSSHSAVMPPIAPQKPSTSQPEVRSRFASDETSPPPPFPFSVSSHAHHVIP